MAAARMQPDNREKTTWRCALYARVSPKPEGAVGDNYSIASQLHDMRDLALREFPGPKPDEFVDDKKSGATLDRPALERLRDNLALRMYDVVIAYSPDRLSRETVDSMILLQEIAKYGAKLVFVSGSYDDSPEGELSFGVQSLVSRYERKKIAERSRRGRKQKAREGYVHSGSAADGYRYLGHKYQQRGVLEIVPERAKVMVMIWEWTAEGMTNYRVALRLNEMGIFTAKGKRWRCASVAQVLKKTVYYGEVTDASGIIIKVPAIIPRELWDRAHAALARNRVGKVGRPPLQYELSGLGWCTLCGVRLTTFPMPGNQAAYRCNGIDHITHKRKCLASGIRKSILEPVVWEAVWDTLCDSDLLYQLIAAYRDRASATKPKAKDPVVARIDRARRRVARAEAILKDPDEPVPYTEAKADLEKARRELLEAETARPAAPVIVMPDRKDVVALSAEFRKARNEVQTFAGRRRILLAVVEKFRYADHEVEITCKLSHPRTSARNCNKHVRAHVQCDICARLPASAGNSPG